MTNAAFQWQSTGEDEDPGEGEFNATAAAIELAAELGVDLSTVTGSGLNGKITKPDVEAAYSD